MLDLDSLEIILQPLLNFQCPSLKVVPILVRRPAERYEAIQQILHALSSVNRVLEVAESLRDRMKELSNYIHLWKSQVLNSLAPVNSLPTELFHLIFDLAVRDQPRIGEFTNVRPALTLSHVCSRWRSASLGLPQLWTTVAITNARALPMLETFFRRAMHYPLRLEAIIDDGWRLDLSSPELSASVSQLKSIFIWSPQSFQAITLPKEPFNSLETFTMRGSNNKVAPIPPQLSQIRHLHLHSVGALGKSTVTFPQLTQLELTHMRESDVRDVFQIIDAPSLGSLYLMNGKASIGVPPQPLSATKRRFPTLERLHIIYCAPEFVEWLFRDLQYPVLRIALIQMDREFESWNHHTEVLRVAFEVFVSL
ncbi:hypothetical protein DL93DRAFT_1065439 [Clavulina sp. PMI_390]|nr:hypothetical protein DL93DRAFT_1065439 [Clavulina sp. PMI_390]